MADVKALLDGLLALAIGAGSLVAQEALTPARFAELFAELEPDAEAPWRTVGWRIDLLEAQRVAAAEDKLLFVWAMDGHPLGCT